MPSAHISPNVSQYDLIYSACRKSPKGLFRHAEYIRSYWETLGEICAEGKYLALGEPFPYDVTVGFMKKIIDEKIPAVFVIDTENDRCIGWCDAVSADGKTGKLGMGILKPYREKGIGTKLLEAVKDTMRQKRI